MIRILLGTPDARLATGLAELAEEAGTFTVARVCRDAGDLVAALEAGAFDAICLHDRIGPLPVTDVAREVGTRTPDTGLVLLTDELSTDVLADALAAGFRGVVTLPPGLENLTGALDVAAGWTHTVRARLAGAPTDEGRGRMVAIAGAKGGVGTTTIALHMACAAVRADPQAAVCLVDFDLQSGDVRSFLDLTHKRSVLDLCHVGGGGLSTRQIDESLHAHPNGLRVLLPPPQGELADDVTADVARRVLGGIRSRFDHVVIDCGSVVTEGSAVAAELSDLALVVVTPDVVAMRAANRLLALWERVQVRKDHVMAVVNRTSRDREIQPELIGRIVDAPVARSTLPADFRGLEPAVNTGSPSRAESGPFADAIAMLAVEAGLAPRRQQRTRSPFRNDAGQVTVETVGLLPVVLVVLLLLWQLGLAGWTAVLGHHTARELSRHLATSHLAHDGAALAVELADVARRDLLPAWQGGVTFTVDVQQGRPPLGAVEVSLPVPLLLPGLLETPMRITARHATVLEGGRWRDLELQVSA